jgi:GH35 family endo-1,4-beta-xylanase
MHLIPTVVAATLALPLASAQLHQLATKAGKKYFGTATDNGELSNKQYVDILTNTKEFGQLTPSNGMKVCVLAFQFLFFFSLRLLLSCFSLPAARNIRRFCLGFITSSNV